MSSGFRKFRPRRPAGLDGRTPLSTSHRTRTTTKDARDVPGGFDISRTKNTSSAIIPELDEISSFKSLVNARPHRNSGAAAPHPSFSRAALMHLNTLSGSDLSKVLAYMARVKVGRHILERYCERMMDSALRGFSPHDVAITTNSLIRMEYTSREMFSEFARFLKDLQPDTMIHDKDLGLIFNAFARAGYSDSAVLTVLCVRALDMADSISSRSGANICHAIGKLRVDIPVCREAVIAIALRVVHNESTPRLAANPQELANIVYAFGNLKISDSEMFTDLVNIIRSRMTEFNPIEVSAIATAVAKMGYVDKELMKTLSKHLQSIQDSVGVFEITSVLHAFSQLEVPTPRALYNVIAPNILSRDASIGVSSKSACILLCAYARSKVSVPDSIRDTLLEAAQNETDSQYLANTLFATGQIGNVPDSVVRGLVSGIEHRLHSFNLDSANVTQIIYALNKLGWVESALYRAVLDHAAESMETLDGRQICNILHALALRSDRLTKTERSIACLLLKSPSLTTLSNQLHSSLLESVQVLGLSPPDLVNSS
jgi:hypothetical protein